MGVIWVGPGVPKYGDGQGRMVAVGVAAAGLEPGAGEELPAEGVSKTIPGREGVVSISGRGRLQLLMINNKVMENQVLLAEIMGNSRPAALVRRWPPDRAIAPGRR